MDYTGFQRVGYSTEDTQKRINLFVDAFLSATGQITPRHKTNAAAWPVSEIGEEAISVILEPHGQFMAT